ncbi:MAG TPA: Fic family protein [Candidatus Baltobacteraceae bacterium]|nr:Fic family protein [Candidatus Baltobacteraceae bacterium]
MALEIRVGNGKRKYYFAHSYRVGGKAKKLRVYLGTDLSKIDLAKKLDGAKAKLANRLLALNGINDPYKTVLSAPELEELKTLEARGRIKIAHISDQDWLKFTETFTYDTNAIEGSTVLRDEVSDILKERRWPNRPKDDISETIGVAEAVRYIRGTREHITIALIRDLHMMVFKRSKPFAGRFRASGTEVAVVDSKGSIIHRGAPSSHIPSLLKSLIKWYNANKGRYSPIVLAAVVHNQFETIHPFQDGNGRVGRLLMINILLRHGLPPLNIELKNRNEYYSALRSYNQLGNIRPTVELMLKEYRSLKKLLK